MYLFTLSKLLLTYAQKQCDNIVVAVYLLSVLGQILKVRTLFVLIEVGARGVPIVYN